MKVTLRTSEITDGGMTRQPPLIKYFAASVILLFGFLFVVIDRVLRKALSPEV